MERKRILLYSEGVTLSQIVRLVSLGRALDPRRFDVHFACAEFDAHVFANTDFTRHVVHSLDPGRVLAAVRKGRRLYDERLLRRQVAEDRELFEEVRPHLVVGDFRWSLSVSAPLSGVPHAALVNAYWSPYAERDAFPVPDHPIVRVLGEELTARYFPVALPHVFSHFAEPVNALRRAHGLEPVGSLLEVLTHGDYVLYADPEELIPTPGAPPSHVHLGFVPWAPEAPLPPALAELPSGAPVVYATLGSSGSIDALSHVVNALGELPVTGLVATAGRGRLRHVPPNVVLSDFVAGDAAARRATVVVSNGGSSTSYQALAEGTPVLGLPSNLDQFLAMQAVERQSAGISLPARRATTESIRSALSRLLDSGAHRDGALSVKRMIERASAPQRFRDFVENVTAPAAEKPKGRTGVSSMSHVHRLLTALGLLVASLTASTAKAERPSAESTGQIRFTVNVDGKGGRVMCALFRESGWLKNPTMTVDAPLNAKKATCVFAGVKPGTYAVVAFHDKNGNGDIDKNFLGLPTESWCASRNAPAVFGPPSFRAARFATKGNVVRLECTP